MRKEKMSPKYKALNDKVISNIKYRRDIIGLKQVELSELLGVSQQNYSEYERGYRLFHPALLLHVAHSLSCSVNELFDGCNIKGKRFKVKDIPISQLSHRAKDLATVFDELPEETQDHFYDLLKGMVKNIGGKKGGKKTQDLLFAEA